jgi:SAM-dependent methyltransferase
LDRWREILRYIGTGTRGIEVAPWYKPLVPRGSEREVVVLDVFDRANLVARAETDPNIDQAMIPQIDEVDLVGSACEIAELARTRFGDETQFDFVVSSHNLEHLPDPVRFLRGCGALLAPGGVVAMVVPDKRACFDYFRPHSSLAEMLQAFHERRTRPSFAQIFTQGAYCATLRTDAGDTGAFTIDDNPNEIYLGGDLVQQYASWLQRRAADETAYEDVHCWTFTPSSLELILVELRILGLIDLDIIAITEPYGCEFIVHLRKPAKYAPLECNLVKKREMLLRQIADELAYTSKYGWCTRIPKEVSSPTLFMIHIPKTGGETINHFVTEMLGEYHVCQHVESIPDFLTRLQSIPREVRYVSGHLRLPDVLVSMDRSKWFVFTNLRNPVQHLVSHLKWVKALGNPGASAARSTHSEAVQGMACRLWEVDLNNIGAVHRFIHEEFEEAKQLFDNSQVRYLIEARDRLINHDDALEAMRALNSFDYVGFTETLSDTFVAIDRALGIKANHSVIPKRNQSPLVDVVNLGDPAIRDFYCNAVQWDAFLYSAAKNA